MNLSQQDLSIIAEALDARLDTGDFTVNKNVKGDIVFSSPRHLEALEELADRIVKNQEAEQEAA